jgi:hypothetical protein
VNHFGLSDDADPDPVFAAAILVLLVIVWIASHAFLSRR